MQPLISNRGKHYKEILVRDVLPIVALGILGIPNGKKFCVPAVLEHAPRDLYLAFRTVNWTVKMRIILFLSRSTRWLLGCWIHIKPKTFRAVLTRTSFALQVQIIDHEVPVCLFRRLLGIHQPGRRVSSRCGPSSDLCFALWAFYFLFDSL
jgi:hypothetical protein